jgi:hypothetical protein
MTIGDETATRQEVPTTPRIQAFKQMMGSVEGKEASGTRAVQEIINSRHGRSAGHGNSAQGNGSDPAGSLSPGAGDAAGSAAGGSGEAISGWDALLLRSEDHGEKDGRSDQDKKGQAADGKPDGPTNRPRGKHGRLKGDDEDDADNEPLTPGEVRHNEMWELAEKGDLDSLARLLTPERTLCGSIDRFHEVMTWLRVGMERAAQDDPDKLISFLGSRTLACQGWLMMRIEYFVRQEIYKHDKAATNFHGDLPPSIVAEWLPRLSRLHEAIEQSSATFARVQHALALAKHGPKKRRRKSAGTRNVKAKTTDSK